MDVDGPRKEFTLYKAVGSVARHVGRQQINSFPSNNFAIL